MTQHVRIQTRAVPTVAHPHENRIDTRHASPHVPPGIDAWGCGTCPTKRRHSLDGLRGAPLLVHLQARRPRAYLAHLVLELVASAAFLERRLVLLEVRAVVLRPDDGHDKDECRHDPNQDALHRRVVRHDY